uniref:Uncharacterized protein n=1 Tax=Rhodnius prolixus TaxID=13249 RepID=T1HP66_RHOPR
MFVKLFTVIVLLIAAVILNSVSASARKPLTQQNVTGIVTADDCVVEHYTWSCCSNFSIEEYHLSEKEYGGEIKLTINDYTVIDEKLSRSRCQSYFSSVNAEK